MDAVRVAQLREVLAGTEWMRSTRRFARTLRSSVTPHGGGLLLVGTETYEPWHLAAHLDDEAVWSGLPELSPTLVRHRVPHPAPAHLSVGLRRIEAAGRRETVLVVTPERPQPELLERVDGARRAGATVLALDDADAGDLSELHGLAHDALTARSDEVDLDTVQHLVSAAAGESTTASGARPSPSPGPCTPSRPRLRDRLSRLADQLAAPPPRRW